MRNSVIYLEGDPEEVAESGDMMESPTGFSKSPAAPLKIKNQSISELARTLKVTNCSSQVIMGVYDDHWMSQLVAGFELFNQVLIQRVALKAFCRDVLKVHNQLT